MGHSSGQRLCPRSAPGSKRSLITHSRGCVYQAAPPAACQLEFLPCSKGRGSQLLLPSDHTDPAVLSRPRTAGHAAGQGCSPCPKDQGCPGMEQAEILGPRSLPGQQDKHHGVHRLTQLGEWECQQLPCIFSLLLSPARQQGWHREQPRVWRQRAAKNAKPRPVLLLPTSVTKSMAKFKH